MRNARFALIEKAGYVGENLIDTYSTHIEAQSAMLSRYDDEEAETLHVAIAMEDMDDTGRVFWTYDF